ncbi:inositol monophosphatase family protein [Pseudomonadota bacterium]|nr:inositol monophosphatase family protein [Pseudomonadota bacterium]
MNIDIELLKKIIITAAKTEVLPRFNTIERAYKPDGSVVTEADLLMQNRIESELKQHYPDIALLGEEMTSEQQKSLLASDKLLWCLDPIDGTSNFAAGMPYFSVSLALISEGESVLGLVYDPIRDECFSAQLGQGAYLNDQKLVSKQSGLSLKKSIALIDFKRLPPPLATQLAINMPYASQRSLGSIALELCWIAAGRGHIYLHAKQHLWDYAAAQLILNEAGAYSCSLEGVNLQCSNLEPQSTIAALDHALFTQWCEYLAVPQP